MKEPRLPMDPANWTPHNWQQWKAWDRKAKDQYSPEMERQAQQLRRWYRELKKHFE